VWLLAALMMQIDVAGAAVAVGMRVLSLLRLLGIEARRRFVVC
jgi:hypothetical protein